MTRLASHLPLMLCLASVVGCGESTPPPKTEDNAVETAPRKPRGGGGGGGGPSMSQELGSIDQRAVEQTFAKLQAKLESCHSQGRGRVEYLSGDVKVFLRLGQDGRVKYGWLDESTLGDRETEKCLIDLFQATQWPKPQGGEAEVRNGFGWPPGSERQPTPWGPEKVTAALDDDKDSKKNVEKCKTGVSGDFRVTAYVEPGEVEGDAAHDAKPEGKAPDAKGAGKGPPKKDGKHDNGKAVDKKPAPREHGGKFKAIGVSPPNKEGAEKIDCVVDALKGLSLPSPGSYAAKVTFQL